MNAEINFILSRENICVVLEEYWGFLGGSVVKICLSMLETQETWVGFQGREDLVLEMASYASIRSGKSHGQRSLAGYRPWGLRVRHDLATKWQQQGTTDWPRQ